MASVFLSYGGPDQDFAAGLTDALRAFGFDVFFFPDSALGGRRLHRVMRVGVTEAEIVILICSRVSLGRPGVLNEIEECLAKEARLGGKEVLVPITLDNHVYADWAPERPDIAQAIRDRVIVDFRKTRESEPLFRKATLRLRDTLAERLRSLPDIEVLSGQYVVDVADIEGKIAHLTYKKTFRPLKDNLRTVDIPDITSSGNIRVVDCNLGQITGYHDEGGVRRAEITADETLIRDKIYELVVRMEAVNCYTEDKETASVHPRRPYPLMSIHVILPADRPAKACRLLRLRETDRVAVPGDYIRNGGTALVAEIQEALASTRYVLEWTW